MRPDAEVYSNTMFSLCNRFIRETLSGNAEGYKVFCIQLDKSRFIGIFYKYESVDQISTKDVISCSKRRNTFATRYPSAIA